MKTSNLRACRGTRRRPLRLETLESRALLSADFPFQNPGQPFDVNHDLRVSALDALQVVNFIGRNGNASPLPDTNTGTNYPDTNGSNSVTALDILLVVNRLAETDRQLLAARLVNDSAPSGGQDLDYVTNQYSLEFQLVHGHNTEQLEIRVDGSGDEPFVQSGVLPSDQPLLVDEAQLDAIAGSPLNDGDHRIEARVVGTSVHQQFVVTIDRSGP